jgi:hypothetical protein
MENGIGKYEKVFSAMPFMHYYHASASHELWFHVAGLSGPYGV